MTVPGSPLIPGTSHAAPSPANEAAPSSSSSSSSLLETNVITGGGADEFASAPMLGAGDEGADAVPLVDAAPPPPPVQTSPEEAALIGKAIGMYVGFGWGLLASKHTDKLIPLADTLLQAHPQLRDLPGEAKVQLGLAAAVGVVEASATRIALKHNIRIPYQDEAIVGTAVGTATLGIVQEFKAGKPKNDNVPRDNWVDISPPAPARDMSQTSRAGQGDKSRDMSQRDKRPTAPVAVEEVDYDDPEAVTFRIPVDEGQVSP